MTQALIYTLGSSRHSWMSFEHLLRRAHIGLLIDVRTSPRSRLPHFNQDQLSHRLAEVDARYVFLGHQLGGHPKQRDADYEAMAKEPEFIAGIDCVVNLAKEARAALMCSEHEPLECHRYLLVGRALAQRGVDVRHLLRDGSIEAQPDTDERLLSITRQGMPDLLRTREAKLTEAYRIQNRRICGLSRGRPS